MKKKHPLSHPTHIKMLVVVLLLAVLILFIATVAQPKSHITAVVGEAATSPSNPAFSMLEVEPAQVQLCGAYPQSGTVNLYYTVQGTSSGTATVSISSADPSLVSVIPSTVSIPFSAIAYTDNQGIPVTVTASCGKVSKDATVQITASVAGKASTATIKLSPSTDYPKAKFTKSQYSPSEKPSCTCSLPAGKTGSFKCQLGTSKGDTSLGETSGSSTATVTSTKTLSAGANVVCTAFWDGWFSDSYDYDDATVTETGSAGSSGAITYTGDGEKCPKALTCQAKVSGSAAPSACTSDEQKGAPAPPVNVLGHSTVIRAEVPPHL
ncbi:hypothetical protein HZB02_00145 [Candidatus Woesearchaeota archaeon]|nr:hypothetical protein [Candidatus Woesearchaeota archaeon]